MIARKVKPGILEIIDATSTDEVESYSLLEITDKDAYLMLTTCKDFSKNGNVLTINYKNDDETDRMFKAIARKHKEDNPTNFIDVAKKYTIDKDIVIPGTSLLMRDPEEHIIRVCKRATRNDKIGNINRLFIDNKVRDEFFDDARVSERYKKTKRFELDTKSDRYAYWSNFMNCQYFRILTKIKTEDN